jgi:hypothetical protein
MTTERAEGRKSHLCPPAKLPEDRRVEGGTRFGRKSHLCPPAKLPEDRRAEGRYAVRPLGHTPSTHRAQHASGTRWAQVGAGGPKEPNCVSATWPEPNWRAEPRTSGSAAFLVGPLREGRLWLFWSALLHEGRLWQGRHRTRRARRARRAATASKQAASRDIRGEQERHQAARPDGPRARPR